MDEVQLTGFADFIQLIELAGNHFVPIEVDHTPPFVVAPILIVFIDFPFAFADDRAAALKVHGENILGRQGAAVPFSPILLLALSQKTSFTDPALALLRGSIRNTNIHMALSIDHRAPFQFLPLVFASGSDPKYGR